MSFRFGQYIVILMCGYGSGNTFTFTLLSLSLYYPLLTLACAALLHPAVRGGTWLEDRTKQTLQARLVGFCRSFHPGGSVADREEEEAAAPAIPATVEKTRRSRSRSAVSIP